MLPTSPPDDALAWKRAIQRLATMLFPPAVRTLPSLVPFVAVALSLIGALLLIFSTIDAERDERAQAQKTSEVLLELRNVGHAAINAETGERGYFITLDQRYLAPYRLGREQVGPALARLERQIGSDATPRQRELLTEIDQLTTAKFAEIEESIGMVGQGRLVEAQTRFLSDEGQEVMDRLRRAISEMERIEQDILAQATARSAKAEARVLPLLGLLLAMLLGAIAFGLRQAVRAARTEAAEANAAELAEARDRADLLARELNHRVKNLFAVILAIVRLSARDAPPEAKATSENTAQRIQALAIAHDVTQGAANRQVADLSALIETTLAPHRSAATASTLVGPHVELPLAKVQPLGLVLHELTTNAVKYGAWNQGGSLAVSWELEDGGTRLVLDWRETCPQGCPSPGERKGFGSMLMDSSARQLQGTIERSFTPEGCHVLIAFPLGL